MNTDKFMDDLIILRNEYKNEKNDVGSNLIKLLMNSFYVKKI